jgi:hypothetical protein
MDPAPVPWHARRTLRRILLAGAAGMAWLALSAAGASADDTAAYTLVPGGAGVAVTATSPDPYDATLSALATNSAGPTAEATAAAPVPDLTLPAPEPTASAPDPALDTPSAVDPAPDPMPGPVPVPDPVPDPATTAPDPVPGPGAQVPDPAATAPDPTLPAVDPVLPVSDPALVPPVVGPAIVVPDPLGPLAGDPAAAPDLPAASTPAPPPEASVTSGEKSGSLSGSAAANEAAAALPPERLSTEYLAGASEGGLPPLYVPPPGTYGALFADALPNSGEPAAPPAAPVPGSAGAPLPSGTDGPGPLHGDTGLPAPDALPPAPGSGSGSGTGHSNGPTGTAAWIPSVCFYLPTTGADPIRGPLQHAPSAVSADPGSSPD